VRADWIIQRDRKPFTGEEINPPHDVRIAICRTDGCPWCDGERRSSEAGLLLSGFFPHSVLFNITCITRLFHFCTLSMTFFSSDRGSYKSRWV
jgi:hypothetical protein